jgi:ubiquinone/menaquinone biosynthesis C-methylase UbiE
MKNHNHHDFAYSGEERKKRQDSIKILKDIGLNSGMVFVDIGSNDGFFTLPAATIVGRSGKVYALDINESAIKRLEEKFEKNGITNYVALAAKAEETIFDENIADFIFFGTVLHDFEDPAMVLQNAKLMLKRDGTLVDLDWQKKVTDLGPSLDIRFSKDKATKLIEDSGLKVEYCQDYDDNYYLIKAIAS